MFYCSICTASKKVIFCRYYVKVALKKSMPGVMSKKRMARVPKAGPKAREGTLKI